jgi:hypothetical protein
MVALAATVEIEALGAAAAVPATVALAAAVAFPAVRQVQQ